MKILVFFGSFEDSILEYASRIGKIYPFRGNSLWDLPEQLSGAAALIVNTGHVDAERLEDLPSLRAFLCPEEILKEFDLASVTALGIAVLRVPGSGEWSEDWVCVLEELKKLLLGEVTDSVENPEVRQHPVWKKEDGNQ